MINTLVYWLFIAVLSLISIAPGFVLAGRLKLKPEERFAVSFGLSFVLLLILIPLFLLGFSFYAYAIMAIFSIVFIAEIRAYIAELRTILLLFVFMVALYSTAQTLWEYPVIGGDWFVHTFVTPHAFETGNWAPPTERPPLFNLIIYDFHGIAGIDFYAFWLSQIVSVIANGIIILPAFLIARRFLDERMAILAALFITITPFIIENAIFTWPKLMAAYFVLLMAYFSVFEKRHVLAGFMAGLAFLSHSYTIIFALTALFLFHRKTFIKFLAPLFSLVILLMLWTYSFYGTLQTSNFIYYPISVGGYSDPASLSREELWEKFTSTPAEKIIGIRAINTVLTLTPAMVFIPSFMDMGLVHFTENTHNWAYLMHFYFTYFGALTAGIYILAIWWLFRKKSEKEKALFYFLMIPMIFSLLFVGWVEYGIVRWSLQPTVPLLIILGFCTIAGMKRQKALLTVVFAMCIIEIFVFAAMLGDFYNKVDKGTLEGYALKYVPDFSVERFVSAHFFADPFLTLAIGGVFIFVVLYLLIKGLI